MSNAMQSVHERLRVIGAVTAAALAAAFLFTSPGMAKRGADSHVKPTIVLVHGAWADGSSWNGVTRRLQRDGYSVVVPAVPLRSLSGDSAYIASVLAAIKGPIVLAAHSYGGAVVTNAAQGNPNVKALVYVDGFVPDAGESVLDLAMKNPGSELPTAITEVPYAQGAQGSGVDVYIKTTDFRSAFAADLPPDTTALMAASQRPVTIAALSEKSGTPAWATIPSWYLAGRQDKAIPLATELFMARRAHAQIKEIDSSHASLLSHPDAVAKVILAATRHVS